MAEQLSPLLNQPPEDLLALGLPIGPAEVCAERLSAYARAGNQQVLVWPLRDVLRPVKVVQSHVAPWISPH